MRSWAHALATKNIKYILYNFVIDRFEIKNICEIIINNNKFRCYLEIAFMTCALIAEQAVFNSTLPFRIEKKLNFLFQNRRFRFVFIFNVFVSILHLCLGIFSFSFPLIKTLLFR